MAIDRRRWLLSGTAVLAGMPAAAHETAPHGAGRKTAVREQKPWGIAGAPGTARRTVVVRMSDAMRFSPDFIEARLGETLRLDLRNDGRMLHELVIGTAQELREHAELMKKFPNMEHDEPWMAHVAPGQRGRIDWTFNRPGEFEFACLIAGHYEAGMRGRILVRSKT
jgi:uncharacterized cupredoxin-like copper-binding protein